MKKRKIILGIIIFLLPMTFVYAGTNDSTIEKHRYENAYAVFNGEDRVHLFYAQRYTLNGITAYCIEPGVAIDTEIYSSIIKVRSLLSTSLPRPLKFSDSNSLLRETSIAFPLYKM